jgi:hypothetical protein
MEDYLYVQDLRVMLHSLMSMLEGTLHFMDRGRDGVLPCFVW